MELGIASISAVGAVTAAVIHRSNPGCFAKVASCGKVKHLRACVIPNKGGKTILLNSLNEQSTKYHFIDVEAESKSFLDSKIGPSIIEYKNKGDWNSLGHLLLQHIPDWFNTVKNVRNKKLVLVCSSLELADALGANLIYVFCPSKQLSKEILEKLENEQDKNQFINSVEKLYRETDPKNVNVYNTWGELTNLFKSVFNVQLKY